VVVPAALGRGEQCAEFFFGDPGCGACASPTRPVPTRKADRPVGSSHHMLLTAVENTAGRARRHRRGHFV